MTNPKIQSTKNYSKFKLSKINRAIDEANVQKLIKENEFQFNMPYYPIVVSNKGIIIDGQHRYEACKAKDWPIYYVTKNITKVKVDDIFTLNRAGKKHSQTDRVLIMANSGNEIAREIVKIRDWAYDNYGTKKVSYDIITRLACGCTGKSWAKILNNDIEDLDFKFAKRICKAIFESDFEYYLSLTRRFILPFARIIIHQNIKETEALDILYKHRGSLKLIGMTEREVRDQMHVILGIE